METSLLGCCGGSDVEVWGLAYNCCGGLDVDVWRPAYKTVVGDLMWTGGDQLTRLLWGV